MRVSRTFRSVLRGDPDERGKDHRAHDDGRVTVCKVKDCRTAAHSDDDRREYGHFAEPVRMGQVRALEQFGQNAVAGGAEKRRLGGHQEQDGNDHRQVLQKKAGQCHENDHEFDELECDDDIAFRKGV